MRVPPGPGRVDVVVVDHHAVPEVMPPAVAVLNPLQPGCDYPTKWLCAGGVTFNLCMGLRKTLRRGERFCVACGRRMLMDERTCDCD